MNFVDHEISHLHSLPFANDVSPGPGLYKDGRALPRTESLFGTCLDLAGRITLAQVEKNVVGGSADGSSIFECGLDIFESRINDILHEVPAVKAEKCR